MIPCCCKSFWRAVDEYPKKESHLLIAPYHLKHLLYLVLILWVGFVLWRIDKERQAATAYLDNGDLSPTSLLEQVAAKMENQTSHIIVSYCVIPGSVPIMLYMLYWAFKENDEQKDCPLGYTAEGHEAPTSGENAVTRLIGASSDQKKGANEWKRAARQGKSPFKYDEDNDEWEDMDESIVEKEPPVPPPFPQNLKKRLLKSASSGS
uniref:Uncharacterized protein n=1 Tax=Lotharella oceanica TaxID=641309 RepID=A0A7S2TKS3_9EUKA|mmetsp:Transcript_16139/g.30634  ORF Transcript_16139/g.30634 Transcript_16139/m.30634 type:complete len:207 (+) Transcript_16139:59-679(+)